MFNINKHAVRAQIESDDVAAVNVLNTGESDIRDRNTRIDDLTVFAPEQISMIGDNMFM